MAVMTAAVSGQNCYQVVSVHEGLFDAANMNEKTSGPISGRRCPVFFNGLGFA
jgi:hypothetical protein